MEIIKTLNTVKKIMVDYVHPPIPIRDFDYIAWFDGEEEEGIRGEGKTAHDAIISLINNCDLIDLYE